MYVVITTVIVYYCFGSLQKNRLYSLTKIFYFYLINKIILEFLLCFSKDEAVDLRKIFFLLDKAKLTICMLYQLMDRWYHQPIQSGGKNTWEKLLKFPIDINLSQLKCISKSIFLHFHNCLSNKSYYFIDKKSNLEDFIM